MNRGVGLVLALVVVIAAAVSFVSAMSDGDDTARLLLSEIQGQVEVSNPEGQRQARAGLLLEAEDRIATGVGARAVLQMNESRIRLGPGSDVRVKGVDQDGVRLELENGSLEATVRPSGPVRVANRGREVVSTGGDFRVGFDGEVLAVEAVEGDVGLQGFPEAARLGQGQELRVAGGHTEIGDISDELLLEVDWPDSGNKKTVWVQGRTEPGLRVKVRTAKEELATERAGPTGVFRIRVDLNEGEHDYTVVALSPMGDEQAVSELIRLDTTGPTFKGGAEYRR